MFIVGDIGVLASVVLLLVSFGSSDSRGTASPGMIALTIIFSVTSLILLFGGLALALSKTYRFRRQYRKYESYPFRSITDFKAELELTRANFAADEDPDKNTPQMNFYFNASDCYDYYVILKGSIRYAYLVKANVEGFKKNYSATEFGAVVLYSTDEFFETDPLELKKIAEKLWRLMDSDVSDVFEDSYKNERSDLIGLLKDDDCFFTNVLLPEDLTNGREVYVTTMMIYRPHLPEGYISDGLFPIIADPAVSKTSLVVDRKYWSENLLGYFINGGGHRNEDDAKTLS